MGEWVSVVEKIPPSEKPDDPRSTPRSGSAVATSSGAPGDAAPGPSPRTGCLAAAAGSEPAGLRDECERDPASLGIYRFPSVGETRAGG